MNTKVYSVIVVAAIVFSAGSVLGGMVKRSDDATLEALQTLIQQQSATVQQQSATIQQQSATIQQQASAIQTLQADVAVLKASSTNTNNQFNNLNNQFNNLNAALTKLSTSVAFTVHFSADNVDHGVDLGDDPILRFDAITTNIGGGYDTHSGMFTASVPGTYAFFLTEMAPDNTPAMALDVIKNDQVLDTVWAPGSLDPDDQGGSSLVTTHLNAGDRVWVHNHPGFGHNIRGWLNTIFTGYLLHADL